MLVAAVLWGTIGPAVVIVADHTSLSPFQTAFWRLIVAVIPLAALAWVSGRVRPSRPVLLFGFAVGASMGASQVAYFAAVADSGIAIPTLIANGLGPIFAAIGQTVIFRSRPDGRTLLALVAALAGLVLLVGGGPSDLTALGVTLSIVSAAAYAGSTLAAGPASRRMETTTLGAAGVCGGLLAMLPFVFFVGGPGLPDSNIGWLAIGWLGLVVSGLAYWLYYSAARELPGTHLTILALLDPLVTALIAIAFFGESLTVGAIVGGTLMLGAVVALRAPPDEEPHPPPA